MKTGDILCLENTRFHPGEEKNDKEFASKLAALGDIFVEDAFSAAHRAHASITAIVTVSGLPAYPGRAMKAELDALEKAPSSTPEHPVAAIVGGAKISTKLDLLGHLLIKVETLIIGGGMANTFLAAQGKPIGKSLCENDLIPTARDILAKAKSLSREIVLPVDVVVAQKFAAHAPSRVVSVDAGRPRRHDPRHRPAQHRARHLGAGAHQDAGLERPVRRLRDGAVRQRHRSKWPKRWRNSPQDGRLVSFAGGGDTVAALNVAGVTGRLTHVSTAGGAFLESLEGKTLPGVEVLMVSETPATARE